MNLPFTSTSLLFWMDPSERFVARDSSNKITSMIERISGSPIRPRASATSPTWQPDIRNGQPALSFGGAHALVFNFAPLVITTGTRNPIVVSVAAKANSFAVGDNSLMALGSATLTNPAMSLTYTSATFLQVYRFDDVSVSTDAAIKTNPSTPTSWHIYTGIYDGTNLILRIDGVQVASSVAANSTGHFTGDQLGIGDYTDGAVGGFGHGYFNGYIGQVVVYGGTSPDIDTENYLKDYYGI